MTDLTKLANALTSMATYNGELLDEEWSSLHEAAHILRAAAGVDVAGLMSLARAIGTAAYEAGQRDEQGIGADASKEVAAENAFESALRMALAQRDGVKSFGEADPLYEKAVAIVRAHKMGSVSMVQRHLAIGYNRAHQLLEAMVGTVLAEPPPTKKLIAASQAGAAQGPKP